MSHSGRRIRWGRRVVVGSASMALVLGALAGCGGDGDTGGGSGDTTLRVMSFGGVHDDVLKQLTKDFETQNNVKVQWEPASATENVAKAAASKAKPTFDVILTEDTNQYSASSQGLLAPLDPAIVTELANVLPIGQTANKDGVGYGINATVMFYDKDKFSKNGWAAPTSLEDLFDPKYCGKVGITHSNVTQTLHVAQLLGGGKPADIPKGLDHIAQLGKCANFETAPATLEQKLQVGEYLIGIGGTLRLGPLSKKLPLAVVFPTQGCVLNVTMASPIKGAPHPELAQRFINFLVTPQVGQAMAAKLSYYPVNKTVTAVPDFVGAISPEQVARYDKTDAKLVFDNRRAWAEKFDRAVA